MNHILYGDELKVVVEMSLRTHNVGRFHVFTPHRTFSTQHVTEVNEEVNIDGLYERAIFILRGIIPSSRCIAVRAAGTVYRYM